ncbi:hypothetical protein MSWHS_2361 [Methanosarcina sp. WWM596]|nr:hypothetical protein MSWHS_2361 [Methanosarcina sp. WWM596]
MSNVREDMKKSDVLLVVVSIVTLIAICLISMPYIFIGPPLPLFSIYNNDINEHEVVIEIFDSNNESVFKQTYEMAPEAMISQSKPVWLLLQLSIPPGNEENYTFKVNLDNNVTNTHQIGLQVWVMADIMLYEDNTENPISIGVSVV